MQNRKSIQTLLLALAGLVLCGSLATACAAQEGYAQGQKKPASNSQVVTTQSQTRDQGGADANVKDSSTKNNANMHTPAPPNKGGKARGAGPYACQVHVDNRTEWLIQVYVDGNFVGTVNRFGDLIGITGNGPTSVYAVATFVDGPDHYWGPHVFSCSAGGSYTWRLGN
ncbi:MAG: hypothetical protein ACRD50_01005 [Candidatus Acidiferrales bacterium]